MRLTSPAASALTALFSRTCFGVLQCGHMRSSVSPADTNAQINTSLVCAFLLIYMWGEGVMGPWLESIPSDRYINRERQPAGGREMKGGGGEDGVESGRGVEASES